MKKVNFVIFSCMILSFSLAATQNFVLEQLARELKQGKTKLLKEVIADPVATDVVCEELEVLGVDVHSKDSLKKSAKIFLAQASIAEKIRLLRNKPLMKELLHKCRAQQIKAKAGVNNQVAASGNNSTPLGGYLLGIGAVGVMSWLCYVVYVKYCKVHQKQSECVQSAT